jgi:acetyl-CoA carboxylase biotin carboxyl carrier protein
VIVARKPGKPPMPKTLEVDHEVIRELARLLDETGLAEIAIERDGVSVRVARHAGAAAPPRGRPADATGAVPVPVVPPVEPRQHPGLVASPMVGTAYRAAEPGSRPFVDIGSPVKTGDTLLIIEAMKTMNQIPAPRAGTVMQILVEDGQPVEYGEPLMIIE